MAVKKDSISFVSLKNEIKKRNFHPIYVLDGQEPYYIDQLTESIINSALSDDEKDFNLNVYYGIDANVKGIIGICKQYPVMAEYQVVVIKEAQNIKDTIDNSLDLFKYYANNPLKSTILIICYKNGSVKAPEFLKELKANGSGIHFSSAKENEKSIRGLIEEFISDAKCEIDEKAVAMLCDFIGTDVSRLYNEINKLLIIVGENGQITPELIERNIGISKDYNIFELEDALLTKNSLKAFKIMDYYEKNPKSNAVQAILPTIFNVFVNILLVHTSKDASPSAIQERLETKSAWRAGKFISAANRYNKRTCVTIISAIRTCDAQSKGVKSRRDGHALLRELFYKIMNS